MSMFCDIPLAARIERAELGLISALNEAARARTSDGRGFLIPVAGGVASFADDDSPFNKVTGLGFDGVPEAAVLDEIEGAFAERGAPTQVELCHLADSEIGIVLSARGYRLESFENVLGRTIDDSPLAAPAPDLEIRRSGDEEFEAWLRVSVEASIHPDVEGLPWHDDFPAEIIDNAQRDSFAAGLLRFAAVRAGELAGAAELRMSDGIAQFAGAGTVPTHRRHGIQTALLDARLAVAGEAGCDVAVIITQPGSRSQQNSQRRGFDLLYTRAILVKHLAS
jgi:GNAT superfamily N-acetyltransferase